MFLTSPSDGICSAVFVSDLVNLVGPDQGLGSNWGLCNNPRVADIAWVDVLFLQRGHSFVTRSCRVRSRNRSGLRPARDHPEEIIGRLPARRGIFHFSSEDQMRSSQRITRHARIIQNPLGVEGPSRRMRSEYNRDQRGGSSRWRHGVWIYWALTEALSAAVPKEAERDWRGYCKVGGIHRLGHVHREPTGEEISWSLVVGALTVGSQAGGYAKISTVN